MPRGRRSGEDVAIFEGMGLAVAELRESRELSKSALAAKARISPSTLGGIELGKVDVTRTHWPFLRDRRIDAYENLTKRFID